MATSIDLPELTEDPRFASNQARVVHRDALNRQLQARIGEIDRSPLMQALERRKVPFGQVNDMQEVFQQPQSKALLLEGVAGDISIRGVRSAVWDGDIAPDRALSPPPTLDQHSQQVIDFVEYTADRVQQLKDQGAIPQA